MCSFRKMFLKYHKWNFSGRANNIKKLTCVQIMQIYLQISAQYPEKFYYKAETKPKLSSSMVFGQNSANKRNKITANIIYMYVGFLWRVTDSLHINMSCMYQKWLFGCYINMAQMNRKLRGIEYAINAQLLIQLPHSTQINIFNE